MRRLPIGSCLRVAVLASTVAAARTLVAQSPFEGTIVMRVTGDNGAPNDVRYQMKDGKMRFEASDGAGQKAVVVMDPPNHRMLVLLAEQKMYMETQFAPPAAVAFGAQSAVQTPAISFTGRQETIAGYPCEHAVFTEADGQNVDVCLARGLGAFMRFPSGNPMAGAMPGNPMAGAMPGNPMAGAPPRPDNGWSAKLGGDAFPLKVTKGAHVELEVTKIERTPLDASLFAPPDGWQKLGGFPGGRPR